MRCVAEVRRRMQRQRHETIKRQVTGSRRSKIFVTQHVHRQAGTFAGNHLAQAEPSATLVVDWLGAQRSGVQAIPLLNLAMAKDML